MADEAKTALRMAMVDATGERDVARWNIDQIRKVAEDSRNFVIEHPELATTSNAARFGKWQMTHRPISPEEVVDWVSKLGAKETPTIQAVSEINLAYDSTKIGGKGTGYTVAETADRVAKSLGVPNTKKNLDVIGKLIGDRQKADLRLVESIFSGENVNSVTKAFLANVDEQVNAILRSPVTLHNMQSAAMTGFLNKLDDTVKAGIIGAIDKQVTVPIARQYLMFGAYGPWNVLETIFRAGFRGHNVIPGMIHSNPIRLFQWRFAHLPNAPVDIMEAQVHALMSVTTEAGESALRAGSGEFAPLLEKITPPGIFRDVEMFGAKWWKKFPKELKSFRNLNEFMATVGFRGLAEYVSKEFDEALKVLAPAQVKAAKEASKALKNLGLKIPAGELAERIEMARIAALIGPDAVKSLKSTPTDFMMERVGLMVDDILSTHPTILEPVKNLIKQRAVIRTLDDVDSLMADAVSALKDAELINSTYAANMYEQFAKELSSVPIQTPEQLDVVMRALGDMTGTHADNLSTFASLLQKRADELTTAAARDATYYEGWLRLSKYMSRVDDSVQEMIDATRASLNTMKDLDPLKRGGIESLLNVYGEQVKLTNATRLAETDLFAKQIAKWGKKPRTDKFWNTIKPLRSAIWDDYHKLMAGLKVDEAKAIANLATTPQPALPKFTGDLLVSHISYLFQKTGDDFVSGLLRGETGNLMSKQTFIETVAAKAEAVASQAGTTADAAGFTKNAISKCYDDIFKSMGLDPTSVTELTPKLLELDDIGRRLQYAKVASATDPEDVVKYNQWLDKLAEKSAGISAELPPGEIYIPRELEAHYHELLARLSMKDKELVTQLFEVLEDINHTRMAISKGTSTLDITTFVEMELRIAYEHEHINLGKLNFLTKRIDDIDDMVNGPKKLQELNNFRQEVTSEFINKISQTDVRAELSKVSESTWKALPKTPKVARKVVGIAVPRETQIKAMEEARKNKILDFPDYTDQNAGDMIAKKIYPFWCVPEDTRILTVEGWKHYSDLGEGEYVLTVNPKTLISEWQQITDIAVFDYDDELIVIPSKGKDIMFTPNHRWLTITPRDLTPAIKMGYELTDGYDLIPRAIPHNFPESSILSERDAYILGWVCTDGYIRRYKGKPRMYVYQSAGKYVTSIEEATGTKAYSRSKANDPDNMVIGVSQVDADRILGICPDWSYLSYVVTRLNKESAESMWDAMMQAEGNTFYAYNGNKFQGFKQNPGPVLEAFQLLSILLGKSITVDNSKCCRVNISNNKKPYQAKQCRRIATRHYTGKVWCPVTPNGTWFANFNGCILPTGNTYESNRWPWLFRTALQKPGLSNMWGKYMNVTDTGYIPIPFTDYQFNPFVGTVFMGGFRRLFQRDYPEYQNKYPWFSEPLDWGSRIGFYVGPVISMALSIFGTSIKRKPDFGEIAPAWASTGIDALQAIAPDNKLVQTITEVIFPLRWRNYLAGLQLNNSGYDGDRIIAKVNERVELDETEQLAYNEALRKVAIFQALSTQAGGMIRYKPEKLRAVQDAATRLTEEMTGISPEVQEYIRQHSGITGKNLAYYMPLDPLQQKILYEASGLRDWARTSNPLLPPEQQEAMNRIVLYQADCTDIRDQATTTGYKDFPSFEGMDKMLTNYFRSIYDPSVDKSQTMTPERWIASTGELKGALVAAYDAIGESSFYKNVPRTLEERLAMYKKYGITLVFHPTQELLWEFNEIKPEMTEDPDFGWSTDWTTYFRKKEAILAAIDDEDKPRFIENMQMNWTPMYKLFWNVNRNYLKKYKMVREIVLNEYSPEEQSIIKRIAVAPLAEREALMATLDESGKKLYNQFNTKIMTVRRNLRLLDPQLDAWLLIWGVVDSPATEQGRKAYETITHDLATGDLSGYIQ
jgi:hypothetical protein